MKSGGMRNSFIYLMILVAVVLVVVMLFRPSSAAGEISLAGVIQEAQAGNVQKIKVEGDILTVYMRDASTPIKSRKESASSVEEILRDNDVPIGGAQGVDIQVKGPGQFGNVFGVLFNLSF